MRLAILFLGAIGAHPGILIAIDGAIDGATAGISLWAKHDLACLPGPFNKIMCVRDLFATNKTSTASILDLGCRLAATETLGPTLLD
jgi:hypothetical protein